MQRVKSTVLVVEPSITAAARKVLSSKEQKEKEKVVEILKDVDR
jgi:hypothetical protein